MKNLMMGLVVALFVVACSEEKSNDTTTKVKISHATKKAEDGVSKSVAQIKVEGMMCEQACGGKVKSELAELDCVKNVEISFDSDNPVDLAIVEFNSSECDENSMISQIHNIGEGVYQVQEVEVITYE